MDVKEYETRLDAEILLIMKLLARLFPPGCKEVINIPVGFKIIKNDRKRLTLRSVTGFIIKLIYNLKGGFMKKYLVLFITIIGLCVSGCVSTVATKEQEKSLDKIQEFPGMKKAELFNKALQHIARTYNSANDVIQLKDPEAGQIICKGIASFDSVAMWGTYYFSYTLIIDIKDAKIRTRFEHIQGEAVGSSGAPDVNFAWSDVAKKLLKIRNDLFTAISASKADDNW